MAYQPLCIQAIVQIKEGEANLTDLFYVTESRPDEQFFGKLDSSLKRNTAFVKKLVSSLNHVFIHIIFTQLKL